MEQPDEHYSLVGGNLVINNPRQKKHAGTYICVARNIYGTVISKEARVKFGCEHVNPAAAAVLTCGAVLQQDFDVSLPKLSLFIFPKSS